MVSEVKDRFAVILLSKFIKPAAHEGLLITWVSLSLNPFLYPSKHDSQEMDILASLCRSMGATTKLDFFSVASFYMCKHPFLSSALEN